MGFEYQSLATGHFQMPDGWSLTTIQEVAEVNEKAITKRNAPSHIHYIDIASVDKGALLDIQELPFEKAPSRARRVVRDKDSLIATVRPNLEHYMFVNEPRSNTIASTGFAVVTAKTADPRFLYYYLTSKPFTAYLTQIAESHTSAYPAFNPDVIEKAELVLPSDSEQRAIAHILGSLDDKIELNRRMNQTLEATARAIFKSWFVDFLPVRAKQRARTQTGDPVRARRGEPLCSPNHGLPDDIAKLFPDSLEDSELGEIPRGWKVVTFEELTEAKQGKYIPKTEMIDLPTNEHIYPVWGGNGIRGYSSTYMYEAPVVVLTCRGSNCGRIDLTESPAWISNIAFACSPKYGSINFINVYFHFSCFSETITGSAQPQITYTSLKNKRMQFPVHKEICDAYSKKIDSLYKMIRENNRQSTTLASLRDALLPKLISGELRVPDAEKFVEEAGL